jgi:hypothetical protein
VSRTEMLKARGRRLILTAMYDGEEEKLWTF